MTRSILAGFTDYSHQSFQDMLDDLKKWSENLDEVHKALQNGMQKIEEIGYWNKVNDNFKSLIHYSIKFFDTSLKEISTILKELGNEVRPDHILRIRRLCDTSHELDIRFGQVWHREYPDEEKDYENPNFRLVEKLYKEGRDMSIDMRDLSNLAGRLEDFVGMKNEKPKKDETPAEILELKPNFYGIGVNFNEILKRFFGKRK